MFDMYSRGLRVDISGRARGIVLQLLCNTFMIRVYYIYIMWLVGFDCEF